MKARIPKHREFIIQFAEDYEKQEEKRGKEPSITTEFNCSPVFYQGMYKELKKDCKLI